MLQNSVICVIAVASLTVMACSPTGTSDSAKSASTPETGTSAYYILTHTITDLETYQNEYVPQVLPFIAKYGGEIVVASPDAEPLQGNPEKGVVVLRFPSEEAVRGFVNDPEYQPAKELRIAVTTNANAVLAPEFQMPKADGDES